MNTRRSAFLVALAAISAVVAGPSARLRADDAEPVPAPAKANLRDVTLSDLPTTVCVPLPNGTSLVVGLPEHLWVQAPRNAKDPKVSSTFDGDGLVLQDIIDMRSGNSHSLAYVGAIALAKPAKGETFAVRFDAFVGKLVPDLAKRYARVDFVLSPTTKVTAERAEILLDGKPAPAWRTSKHPTTPSGYINKPDAVMTTEVALVGDEPSNTCLYLVSASKMMSLTLDQLLPSLSIRKTPVASPTPRRVQLLDISEGRSESYPVRLAVFEAAPGFVQTADTIRLKRDLIYAEDRVDAKGRVTATFRISARDHAAPTPIEDEVEKDRVASEAQPASDARVVELGTTGARARVFSGSGKVDGRPGTSSTAVVEVDDKIWTVVWTTYGDAAAVAADTAAFETLLHGLQLATR